MQHAADDYDVIYERMKELRGCPTARALHADVQYFQNESGMYCYKPITYAAISRMMGLAFSSDGYAYWEKPPHEVRRDLCMDGFIFEEVPVP